MCIRDRLDTLTYNLNRKQDRAFLFEIGAVYSKQPNGFVETTRVSGLAYGSAKPEQWATDNTCLLYTSRCV